MDARTNKLNLFICRYNYLEMETGDNLLVKNLKPIKSMNFSEVVIHLYVTGD